MKPIRDVRRAMSLTALLAVLLAGPVHAEPAPITDPVYLAPPASLTPEQVAQMQKRLLDWPQLARYRDENAALPPAAAGTRRVVFFGDSITEGWGPTGS